MDKTVWIITGHQGGCGKSVLSMCLVEWLVDQGHKIAIVDGDLVTRDIAKLSKRHYPTIALDLETDPGWDEFADFLCSGNLSGHFVANTRNSLTPQTLGAISRFCEITKTYGFTVSVLYIVPKTRDPLFAAVRQRITLTTPVKNLANGARPSDYGAFDTAHGPIEREVLLPPLRSDLMDQVKLSSLNFHAFTLQKGDAQTNCVVPKIEVAEWRDHMLNALDDLQELVE
jgi:predicted ABC-type ATPase